MSGQRHRDFHDQLARYAADARWAAIAERVDAPLRVAVSGRRGVGRRTVARALALAGVSVTPDADLQVHVVAEVVKPEDRAEIAAAQLPVLAVQNKADVAREPVAALGVPIQPMVGLLAVAVLDDELWDALRVLAVRPADLSSPDSFVAGVHPVRAGVRRRLVDTVDLFGVTQSVAAIRQGVSKAGVGARLRRLSRIDAVLAQLAALGAQVHYRRMLDAVAELEALAVTDPRAAEFLSRDDTVIARMAAAVDVVEAAGLHVDRGESPAAHLRRAVQWRRYGHGPVSGIHRACGADIVRGSLRLWSHAGGSP
ncbi:hypothetical protein [Mycobacterium celatum]|uniref:Uncharacterized protein n=2 Tax=Mycobacterium celatum TaxID=28045 RepID=A0A1X1RR41_MYCCE|nr:hypothetical protein [Mycobacterium celatum]ORV13448.1 hypothetical protein AWB95_11470 [Mycobacterium celatum]PIB78125.1 hypothetical protein CQY23_15410 [Mycobacterium celatum]